MAEPTNSMDALASLLQLFQGQKTTKSETAGGFTESRSGGTQTTQTNLDQETLAGLLKQALEGNQGLASVSQGQRTAGLFNSSTNRLLSNDLLSRLTTQTAATGASKTVTETPSTITRAATPSSSVSQVGGLTQNGSANDLAKLMAGIKLYNEMGGTKGIKKGFSSIGSLLTGDADAGAIADYGSPIASTVGGEFTAMDSPIFSANSAVQNVTDQSFNAPSSDMSFMLSNPVSFSETPSYDYAGANGYGDILSDAFGGFTADQIGTVPDDANFDVPTEDAIGNFSQASVGTTSDLGNPSSSQVLAEANSPSADTTSLSNAATTPTYNAASGAASVYSLYKGVNALRDDNPDNDIQGGVNTATGAYGTYKGAEAISSGADVSFSGGSGSALGYVGPVMDAIYAGNNPEGEQNKDYRKAVGGAVLNYFGFGWATPIVDKVARPALNASMEAGNESLGNFGTVLADPIGAPLSGEYDVKDLVTSTLDPANIFGGNEGGSVGGLVALGVDPIGAALGDKGVFSAVSDGVNKLDSAIAPGRVVCTELALAGDISMTKYQAVIQPSVTLRGRILLGYHVLGIPAVRRLRADKRFREAAIPYVNAYLDHKLGKWNWRGFIIKTLGEPLCYLLSFVNRDPEAYKTLYPYRRNRNGCK